MPFIPMTKHKGSLVRHPRRHVAFAIDYQGDDDQEPTFVFVGADSEMLDSVFSTMTSLADSYRIEFQHPPVWRQRCPYHRLAVRLEGYHRKVAEPEELPIIIAGRIRPLLNGGNIDYYQLDVLLNIEGRDPEHIIPLEVKRPEIWQPKPKKRGRKTEPVECAAVTQQPMEQATETEEEDMANIYVRLPWYVAAFYRGLEEDNPLTEWQPYEFKEYTHEYVIMENNLRYIPEQNLSRQCYSQRAWNNILHGKTPDGSVNVLRRDPTVWPDTNELCTLTGTSMMGKMATSDYLAVKMPREVWLNRKVYRTNQGYAFSADNAQHFIKMLSQEFYHVFLDWVEQDERYCNRMGIHRKNLEVMERFLVQYNIPISVDSTEQDTLRRMRNRWMANAKKRPNDRVNFNQVYLEHISDDDRRRAEKYKKK